LSKITVPTLILAGKYDRIFPLIIQENLSQKIDGSRLIVLDNLRHNLLVGKNNIEIISMINDFIKKDESVELFHFESCFFNSVVNVSVTYVAGHCDCGDA